MGLPLRRSVLLGVGSCNSGVFGVKDGLVVALISGVGDIEQYYVINPLFTAESK